MRSDSALWRIAVCAIVALLLVGMFVYFEQRGKGGENVSVLGEKDVVDNDDPAIEQEVVEDESDEPGDAGGGGQDIADETGELGTDK